MILMTVIKYYNMKNAEIDKNDSDKYFHFWTLDDIPDKILFNYSFMSFILFFAFKSNKSILSIMHIIIDKITSFYFIHIQTITAEQSMTINYIVRFELYKKRKQKKKMFCTIEFIV